MRNLTIYGLCAAVLLAAACGGDSEPDDEGAVLTATLSALEEADVPVRAAYASYCDDAAECEAATPADTAEALREAAADGLELVPPPQPEEDWPLCPWVTRDEEEAAAGPEGFLLGFERPDVAGDSATVLLSRSCRSPATVQLDRFRLARDETGAWRVTGIERGTPEEPGEAEAPDDTLGEGPAADTAGAGAAADTAEPANGS